jgi:hypothetical protein
MRRAETSPEPSPLGFACWRGWRGPGLAALGVVLLALAAPATGRTAAGQRNRAAGPDLAALPRQVREALDRAARVYGQPLRGARWSEVHLLRETDHPLYQFRGTNARGNTIEIEVTSAGRVIEVEEHGIPPGEVPRPVSEALKARMPQFRPTRVEAIYQAEYPRPVSFGFEGEDAAGRTVEVYVSADGKTFLN